MYKTHRFLPALFQYSFCALALSLIFVMKSIAADAVLGLNFSASSFDSTRVAGYTADGFSQWVDSRPAGDASAPATQTTPLMLGSSGVGVTWSAANTWAGGAESNREQSLYRVYLDDGGSGGRITITGLSAWLTANGKKDYIIRCYASSDSATSFRPISVRAGTSATGTVLQTITPTIKGNGNYPTSGSIPTSASPARGWVDTATPISNDSITLTIAAKSGSSRGTIAAFRITASTPLSAPTAVTDAATSVIDTEASINGTVNAKGGDAQVSFEFGPTESYGNTINAVPASLSGNTNNSVTAKLTSLLPNTTYHYRVVASSSAGTTYGIKKTFSTTAASNFQLDPRTYAASVRSGETLATVMSLNNVGEGPGAWEVELLDERNLPDSMAGVLSGIDASNSTINGAIPSRFDFTEGETGSSILSGDNLGVSIFSGGNILSTSLGSSIPYSNGVVASSSALGAGGSYFTRKLPGLFIFGADMDGPSWFEVNGYISFATERQISTFSVTHKGKRWSAFVSKTKNYWRTINHLILVDQQGLTATTAAAINDQKHRISGLSGKCRLVHMLFVTSNTTMQPDAVFENIAAQLLNASPDPLNGRFSVNPQSGSLAAQTQQSITLTANAQGLLPGDYPMKIRVKKSSGVVVDTIIGNLEVTNARLQVPSSVNLSAVSGQSNFVHDIPLTKNDADEQPWIATLPYNPSWLSIEQSAGTTPHSLQVQVNATNLTPGIYETSVQITSGPAVMQIPVKFEVLPLAIRKFLPHPSRPFVYAINQNAKARGQLLEIDTIAKSIVRSVFVGNEPTDLDFTENGQKLVVMNTTTPSLSVVDVSTFSVTETIPLAEFDNRNEDVGGHVKCGKGSIVYYVDEQWGPRLRVFDTATKTVLQTLSSENGTSPNTGNNYGFGDINLTPDKSFLFGWRQYGDGAGVSSTHLVRFAIGVDGQLSGFAKSSDYALTNFTREPFDTPVIFTRNGSRLIIKDRVVDQTTLNDFPLIFPDEIYAVSPGGEIASSAQAIYSGVTGESIHTLSAVSTVKAILPDYSSLVSFNATTKRIDWLNLPSTLGNEKLGLGIEPANGATVSQPARLKWLPVASAAYYQVHLGINSIDVENGSTSSSTYLGQTNNIEMPILGALEPGQTYFWRVVPIDAEGQPIDSAVRYSFIISELTLSRNSVITETVQGVTNQIESIQIGASTSQSWTASENVAWIKSVTTSGSTPDKMDITIDTTGLAVGTHVGKISIHNNGKTVDIPVSLKVHAANFMIAEADLDLPYVYLISQPSNQSDLPSFLLRLNTATDKIESSIPCGKSVTDLAIHYHENRLYLTNWKSGILRAYDRTSFQEVQTYAFAPVGPVGYGEGGIWKISAGKAGRLIIEESDQWIDIRLIDTANGAVLSNLSGVYAGDGEADPTGRYYYHSAAISSSDSLTRYDLSADTFVRSPQTANASAGSVFMIPDGSRFAAGAVLYNPQPLLQFALPTFVYAATLHGDLLFTSNKVYNGSSGIELVTLPVNTTTMTVSGDQQKLYQFPANLSTYNITRISNIATVPSRDLTPAIADGTTVIGVDQDLAWSMEPTALHYDLYFGTSEEEVANATTSSPQYLGRTLSASWSAQVPPLALGSTYFWRVDIKTYSTQKKGEVWSFKVAPLDMNPRSINLVLPTVASPQMSSIAFVGANATWSASTSTPWLDVDTATGTTSENLLFQINPAGLAIGAHKGAIRITSGSDVWDFPVSLEIIALNFKHAVTDLDKPLIYAISQAASGADDRAFLLAYDTVSNQVNRVVSVGRSVTSVSIHYAENRIYVTNWASGLLRAFDRDSLVEVQTYQFTPAGATGYSSDDVFVVASGRNGRVMVEEQDQWIDFSLIDTANGSILSDYFSREGGGLFEPSGRYYYHGENNSSGAVISKHDTDGDEITVLQQKRVESYSYYGSRLVAMSGDGSRVFWNGGVFDSDLNVLMQLNEEVVSSTYRGELLFTNTKAINGSNSQTLGTLPVDTKIQAVSGDQKKLFLFKNAAVTVVNVANFANVPPRGLLPGIKDGSTVIGTSQELTWSLEASALSYDIYFGTSAAAVTAATKSSSEFLGSVTGNRWTGVLPSLSLGGEYFWRIDINSFSSVTKGSTWSFGVASVDVVPRSVKIAAPTGSNVPKQSLALNAATTTSWTASTTTPWITLRSSAGTTPSVLEFDVNTTGLTVGSKNGFISLQAGGKTFTVPVELSIVTLNVTKLITHPNRPVVYGINTSLAGEGFCHLLEINPVTAAIMRTLPIGFAPTDADLDPVSERMYISNWGYSQTRVIDLAAWSELPTLNLGEDIYKLEVTPDGRLLTEEQDQWIVMSMWDALTGEKLVSSADPYFNVREGDGQADPTGKFYYRCDNNSSGATVQKYDISNDSFVQTVLGPQIGYGSRNLILSEDGKRLFWLGRTLDENLNVLATMPASAEVYATNRSGDLAVGESAIWWSDSGTLLAALPWASKIAAISSGDSYLVRFNATSRSLQSTAIASLTDLPGPWPRPGQILQESPVRFMWTPVAQASSYRIFIAKDLSALQAMSMPSATVGTASHELSEKLGFGQSYFWRVDAVMPSGIVSGKVQSFTIRYPQGPELPLTLTNSAANAVSVATGRLLLGWSSSNSGAQLFDFDTATGVTASVQSFTESGYFADHYFGWSVAADQDKAFVGAYVRDNPADGGGNVFAYRASSSGYWAQANLLAPPTPAAGESFGRGLAASGNLMLAGTGNTYSLVGRVAAYITEPNVVETQVFSATDGVAGDAFGSVIAMDGNRAIIAAPGLGSSYNRIPCLYYFTRSTDTGLWRQIQKITIPGATSSSNAGYALALDGTTMAVRVSSSAVAIFTETTANQWVHSTTIQSSALLGATYSFGNSLALHGDQLFIGDSSASYMGTSGGVVYSLRRNGSSWIAGPIIAPEYSRSSFGAALAAREGWLFVSGSFSNRPVTLYRIDATANAIPQFTKGAPSQFVVGRAFSSPLTVVDADGNAGLSIRKLQGPSWLQLSDQGYGSALLTGTPVGLRNSSYDVQFEASDGNGAKTLWTTRITLLDSSDSPTIVQHPVDADLGVGQEFVLRAGVTGIGPFQWQWYHDGNPILGANSDTLVLGDLKDSDAGRYHVSVTNAVAEVVSSEATLFVSQSSRYAGDWLTFGSSPSHTGRHPATLGSSYFQPAWSKTVQSGLILNRAAISNNRAVVVSKGSSATNTSVQCLDLKTGESSWSFSVPPSSSINPPSINQGYVYFQRGQSTSGSDRPQLFKLDFASGRQLWASEFGAQWESYEAPTVSDLGIFVNGGTYGGMYRFGADGVEKFFVSLEQYDDWTPTLANGRLFSWVAGKFVEHNPINGSVLWTLDTGWDWNGWSMNTVSAVLGNTAALISTTELVCVDLYDRSVRWRVPSMHSGSPAIAANRIFAIQGNAVRSYAIEDGDADVVYQTSMGANSTDFLLEQPIIFNDRLVISNSATTWVFDLAGGQLLQTIPVGGRLSYSNSYLLIAGTDGVMRTFRAVHDNADLADLTISTGTLVASFDPAVTEYIATVPYGVDQLTLTAGLAQADATIKINGTDATNQMPSDAISLSLGNNTIPVVVLAENGVKTKTYTVVVTRLPQEFAINSSEAQITANGFDAANANVPIRLAHAPVPGSILTLVNNTGSDFILGRFSNLAHGQKITLVYDGKAYDFVVNYYGGTGNDLVLHWADTKLFAWGQNNFGQLGDGSTVRSLTPKEVPASALLDGKTIIAAGAGYLHSLVLCSDGSLVSWGYNLYGQLGDGSKTHRSSPVAVNQSTSLAARQVVSIAVGPYHQLALCADGTVHAWGHNSHGQLGDGTIVDASTPVLVDPVGALAGKRVVAVAAGAYHSLALCSDGSVVAWGFNEEGELGNGSNISSRVPVAVDASGVLAGKRVTQITAGQYHNMALCSDGTLVSWGYNLRGQLGNGSTSHANRPVAVNQSGVLAGKMIRTLRAGLFHSAVLCDDGAVALWGGNNRQQLGVSGMTQSTAPLLFSESAEDLSSGGFFLTMRRTDGSLAAWGENLQGQLGNGTSTTSAVPVAVETSAFPTDSRAMMHAAGSASLHNLSIIALPARDAPVDGIEAWRLATFGSAVTSPDAADLADCDGDGTCNLLEYAFGSNPHVADSATIPSWRKVNGYMELSIADDATQSDIVYGAECSSTLRDDDWQNIAPIRVDGARVFRIPVNAQNRMFMRLKVTRSNN